MPTRRELLSAGTGAALALPAANWAEGVTDGPRPRLPDLGFLRNDPLVDADRARFFMDQLGVDALVVTHPSNVCYLTNHWPQLDRMGFRNSMMAVFPRDPARPVALIMHAFSYYYTHSPEDAFSNRQVYPYTSAVDSGIDVERAEEEPAANSGDGFRIVDEALIRPRELQRRRSMQSAQSPAPSPSWALARALNALGLEKANLGIDAPVLDDVLRRREMGEKIIPAENVLRRIRFVKSPTEIRLMRLAAQANVEAAMAVVQRARKLGSTRALRAEFLSEAARRGNHGVFVVINGTSSELVDEPIKDGMAFLLDCVSHCRFYHGDFGRTVFIGEPHARMQRGCEAIATAWREIQEQLRPGLRFADVTRIGRECIRRQGLDLNVAFRPHSVGLFHTDHPQPGILGPRVPDELVIEENMILSVDCPILEAGIGGTAHLEDLMLIRASGNEAIHEVPPSVLMV